MSKPRVTVDGVEFEVTRWGPVGEPCIGIEECNAGWMFTDARDGGCGVDELDDVVFKAPEDAMRAYAGRRKE